MFRSRLFTVMTVAGLLGLGSAALVRCGYSGGGMPPPTTTTTTVTFLPHGQLGVTPSDAPPGSVVSVRGSDCSSVAGNVPVFLATTEAPSTRLSESDGFPEMGAPGDWSVELTIPPTVAPGSDYIIDAECWGDGYNQGHPGQVVKYFDYDAHPFTVDAAP